MSADTETRIVVDDRPKADDGISHTVCCQDDGVSLCGLDVSDEPWSEDCPFCVICEHVWERKTCPKLGRCVLAPGASS